MTIDISDKRQAILKAALELFVERGFHNTPTSLIAKQAGVATGTLFHHFKNKEELINALYMETKTQMGQAIKQNFQNTGSLEERMRQLFKEIVKWGILNPKEYRFIQQFTNSPFITKLTRDKALNQFEYLTKIINELVNSGELKAIYPEFIEDFLEGVFKLAITHFRRHPDKISEETIDRVFDICWYGIFAK
ncbi:MAG: TetR/AcrR family transcriptional regulator [Calditrichia bacterium]